MRGRSAATPVLKHCRRHVPDWQDAARTPPWPATGSCASCREWRAGAGPVRPEPPETARGGFLAIPCLALGSCCLNSEETLTFAVLCTIVLDAWPVKHYFSVQAARTTRAPS